MMIIIKIILIKDFFCALSVTDNMQYFFQLTYLTGVVFAVGSSIAIYFIPAHKIWMVYIVAATIGVGGALMLITSLSFVADLIGDFTVRLFMY